MESDRFMDIAGGLVTGTVEGDKRLCMHPPLNINTDLRQSYNPGGTAQMPCSVKVESSV